MRLILGHPQRTLQGLPTGTRRLTAIGPRGAYSAVALMICGGITFVMTVTIHREVLSVLQADSWGLTMDLALHRWVTVNRLTDLSLPLSSSAKGV